MILKEEKHHTEHHIHSWKHTSYVRINSMGEYTFSQMTQVQSFSGHDLQPTEAKRSLVNEAGWRDWFYEWTAEPTNDLADWLEVATNMSHWIIFFESTLLQQNVIDCYKISLIKL